MHFVNAINATIEIVSSLFLLLSGHKEKCEFKNCTCRSCLVVVERQKITAARVAHLRLQRKSASKRINENNRHLIEQNPLTEEEEFVLSTHLEEKNNGKNGESKYAKMRIQTYAIKCYRNSKEILSEYSAYRNQFVVRDYSQTFQKDLITVEILFH